MKRVLVGWLILQMLPATLWAESVGLDTIETPLEPVVSCWLESGATKLFKPDDLVPGEGAIAVHAMRGETESVQLVIRNETQEGVVEDVTVTSSPMFPTGHDSMISADHVQLFLEHFIHIEKPSPCDSFFSTNCGGYEIYQRTPGDYPDPLIPFFDPYDPEHPAVAATFSVPQADFAVVWVDLEIPREATPGVYLVTLEVLVNGTRQTAAVVNLRVWDIEVPVDPSMATSFGMGESKLWEYHGGTQPTPADQERIWANYDRTLHAHRMALRGYGPEITFQFDELGQLIPPDFSAWDEAVRPHVDGTFYEDDGRVNRFNLGMFRPGGSMMGLTEEQFIQAARAMIEHLDDEGFLPHIYLYSLDEPFLPDNMMDGSVDKIRTTVELLNQANLGWLAHVMVTSPWLEDLDDVVGIWVNQVPLYGDVYFPEGCWAGKDKYDELREQGKELWFYACNGSYPGILGYDLDSKIGYEPRLLSWGSWFEGATGWLYWRTNYWLDPDPWAVVGNWEGFGEQFTRNGDGILLYPGDHDGNKVGQGSPEGVDIDGPVVSFRMKQVRDGLEDWELFIIAENLGLGDFARDEVQKAYHRFGDVLDASFDLNDPPFTLTDEPIYEARLAILTRVDQVLHPPVGPEPVEDDVVEPSESDIVQDSSMSELITQDIPGNPDTAADVPGTDETTGSNSGCQAATCATQTALWFVFLSVLAMAGLRAAGRRRS